MYPKKKVSLLFGLIKGTVALFYKKMKIEGAENMPERNTVFVANHSQMAGPISAELYMPDNCYIWCAGQMMKLKEVPAYAYEDFWSEKPKLLRPFFKALSYIIAPLSVCVFNNARTVSVYHDMRILSTFRTTLDLLKKGANIFVFPEKKETYNNIIYNFQNRFIDIAKLYYKSTGEVLSFVPVYISPALSKMYVGKPVEFCPDNDFSEERERICSYLMQSITDMAVELPEHKVVPYKNVSKKKYLTNKDVTEVPK